MESLRNQDMRAEQSLAEFMDVYFYARLKDKNNGFLSWTRMNDKESQLKGIDVCIETDGRRMFIDEKAAVYYSNAMIPTFAFEIDSIQRGHAEPVQGWFVNDNVQTEYYMLIWPNVKCICRDSQWVRKEIGSLRRDDFTIIEAMLIEKSDIRDVLERKGYGKSRLLEYARQLRAGYEADNTVKEKELDDKVKILLSGQLAEKPINLIIRKEMLRDMAKGIYLISADGFATSRP